MCYTMKNDSIQHKKKQGNNFMASFEVMLAIQEFQHLPPLLCILMLPVISDAAIPRRSSCYYLGDFQLQSLPAPPPDPAAVPYFTN